MHCRGMDDGIFCGTGAGGGMAGGRGEGKSLGFGALQPWAQIPALLSQ